METMFPINIDIIKLLGLSVNLDTIEFVYLPSPFSK